MDDQTIQKILNTFPPEPNIWLPQQQICGNDDALFEMLEELCEAELVRKRRTTLERADNCSISYEVYRLSAHGHKWIDDFRRRKQDEERIQWESERQTRMEKSNLRLVWMTLAILVLTLILAVKAFW